ncbi:hypothetical protein LSAT2_021561 [Lamellibrachia satsuma]|nr:hypothetical protein LSAT2_021561 [Lamellibrachia satsuma]
MSIRFPPSFEKDHPEAMKNLRTNAHRLSSPFDIHATFHDIIRYSAVKRGDVKQRGISLLSEIPETRTCAHVGIEPHWCACLTWTKMDVGDEMAVKAAVALVATINSLTETQRKKCEQLTLADVSLAVRYTPNESILKFKRSKDADGRLPELSDNMASDVMYQVTIATKPGYGHYEGTLSYSRKDNKFHAEETDISRTNKYGTQPHCVMDAMPHLRKYCYCREQIK